MDFLRLARSQTVHEELKIPFRDVCGKTDRDSGLLDFDAIENKQLVIASGEYDLKFYDIPGRLQIDMYAYFRRDFNLSSYKLDDVASSYISDSIQHVNNLIDENGNDSYILKAVDDSQVSFDGKNLRGKGGGSFGNSGGSGGGAGRRMLHLNQLHTLNRSTLTVAPQLKVIHFGMVLSM